MIYVKDKESVKKFIESLRRQFKDKGEDIDPDKFFTQNYEDAECYIVDESEFLSTKDSRNAKKFEPYFPMIITVKSKISCTVMEKFLKYNVLGVFRKDRLEYEYEEMGNFEKLLKEIIRELDKKLSTKDERSYVKIMNFKKISNWKLEIEDPVETYKEKKYISLFYDKSMRDFSVRLRAIIKNINQYKLNNSSKFEEIEKIIDNSKTNINLSNYDGLIPPSLLIEGETGTGKSMIAEIISNETGTGMYKFSLVNIEKNLVDTELFGSREGAYTDAKNKHGKILKNAGKIIFLDEIAEADPMVQTKLLLYLDDFKVIPIGSDECGMPAPAFIIAATNKDLKEDIKKGTFRSDLYYRFRYRITVPSLKERKSDIRFLINFILQNPKINPYSNGRYEIEKISIKAIEKLEEYNYPGNFREMEFILQNAVNNALSERKDILLSEHLEF